MRRSQPHSTVGTLIILILFALAPLTTDAAEGEVKGLTVTPPTIPYGGTATIQIEGKEVCGKLDLAFGDATQISVLNATFPKSVTHTYTKSGTLTVAAVGVINCKGHASATLTVQQSPLAQLCATVNCFTAFMQPKIEKVFPLALSYSPGQPVLIGGSGFGSTKGKGTVLLVGMKKYTGADIGGRELTIVEWKNDVILAKIPDGITEVMDQSAFLQVKTQAGKLSNPVSVPVRATRDYVLLPFTDPPVKLISCGNDADLNACNNWQDGVGVICSTRAFCGLHMNLWAWSGVETGTDHYSITLKNGWVFEDVDYSVDVSAPGEASASAPSGFQSGSNSWQPSVTWEVTANDSVSYWVSVHITGPKGVPWK
ncbi:MAG: hypothetical protein L0191_08175 [Acidobacteria bacterium]|nr:hypothetical protein [Acidobacteriota bacterium]